VAADIQWLPLMMEKGLMGPDGFAGWVSSAEVDYIKLIDHAREYNYFIACLFPDTVLLNGPVSAIEEEIKVRCDYGKQHPKFATAFGAVDYWAPPEHVDAAVAACKKYGKY
jgi:hypothetical protein